MPKPIDKKPKKDKTLKTHGKSGQAHGWGGSGSRGGLKLSTDELTVLVGLLVKAAASTPVPAEIAAINAIEVKVQAALEAATAVEDPAVDPEVDAAAAEDAAGSKWGKSWKSGQ